MSVEIVEVVGECTSTSWDRNFSTVIEAIIAATIDAVSHIELRDGSIGLEAQSQRVDLLRLAKLQSSKAEVLGRAGSCWVEEISLIYVYLVIHSVHKVRVNGFLEVLKRFEVGNLAISQHVIVVKVYSAGRPPEEL